MWDLDRSLVRLVVIINPKLHVVFGNQMWLPPFRHLPKLQACLQSSDVNYRIIVGETIALLVELGRDIDKVSTFFFFFGHALLWFWVVFFLVLFTYFMPLICAAVRGGGKWESVSVSEKLGHRRQQAPSKERQEETALHLQRGAALHRGATLHCSRHAVCSKSHTYASVSHVSFSSPHRGRSLRKRPSSSVGRGNIHGRTFTSTAGWREGATTPSGRSWSLEWDTIWRSEHSPLFQAIDFLFVPRLVSTLDKLTLSTVVSQ